MALNAILQKFHLFFYGYIIEFDESSWILCIENDKEYLHFDFDFCF